MEYGVVASEEVRGYFPNIPRRMEVLAYDAREEGGGKRLALAVFIPSFIRKELAVMYHFSLDFNSGMPEMMGEFFEKCFEGLRKKNYELVFYKGVGETAALASIFDVLTGAGFEPRIYYGEMLIYRLSEILKTGFMEDFNKRDGGEEFVATALDASVSRMARNFMNTCAAGDVVIQRAFYSPAYSFICYKDDANAGLCCMEDTTDGLMMTSYHVVADSKKNRQVILRALLGAIIERAAVDHPEDATLGFVFRDRIDNYEAEKILEGLSDTANFQEFVYEL